MALAALDLFCGAGGFSLGLQSAGYEVVGAVDNWSPAVQTYRANFKHPCLKIDLAEISSKSLGDSFGIKRGALDLMVGCPPCQGFSVQRIGEDIDLRNNLVLAFAKFIVELQPRMFLMENVPGLLGKRGKSLAAEFEIALRQEGYDVRIVRVNAADYGVPQIRKRVIFFGTLDGTMPKFPEPTHRKHVTVMEAIGDLDSPPDDFSPAPNDSLHRRMRLSSINQERIRLIPPGGGMQDLPPNMRVKCHKDGPEKIGHRYVYGRLSPDLPAGTITARFDSFTRGKFGHPTDHRTISLREGARLQTFPDQFQFFGTQEEIAALIGNAVPPMLAEITGLAFRRK